MVEICLNVFSRYLLMGKKSYFQFLGFAPNKTAKVLVHLSFCFGALLPAEYII